MSGIIQKMSLKALRRQKVKAVIPMAARKETAKAFLRPV